MITRLTKGNNWKPQHTIGTRYTSDLAWTMNVGIYFANVDCGSWNVESGLASHATIHGVYLHGSCTVGGQIGYFLLIFYQFKVIVTL